MANVFRRPRAFNLLQGRFCTGADTTAYANVSGRTQLHYAAASGRTRLHMQNRPRHYCICNNVLRIVLHRGHNCMRHRHLFLVSIIVHSQFVCLSSSMQLGPGNRQTFVGSNLIDRPNVFMPSKQISRKPITDGRWHGILAGSFLFSSK